MADEVNRILKKTGGQKNPQEVPSPTLKSEIKSDKRKLIIYSELLKPKF